MNPQSQTLSPSEQLLGIRTLKSNPFFQSLLANNRDEFNRELSGLLDGPISGDGVRHLISQLETIGKLRGLVFMERLLDSTLANLENDIKQENGEQIHD